ncbi:MAG: hypothetical protein CMO01_13070 [Thalassobius sp.]|nr:hypothetical protein [Thalassovita sp.]
MIPSEIFISYSWKEESNKVADELEKIFKEKSINILRDIKAPNYKGLIREFMQRVGKGKFIILIISDKYLKSESCIYELIQIYKTGKFQERIFPVVLDSAKIHKAVDRVEYVNFWEKEIKALDNKINNGHLAALKPLYEELDLCNEIEQHILQLSDILKNINAFALKAHREEKYADLIKSIEKQVKIDTEGEVVEPVHDPEIEVPADNSPEAKRLRELHAKIEEHYKMLDDFEAQHKENSEPREDIRIRQEINKVRLRIRQYKEEINMIRG